MRDQHARSFRLAYGPVFFLLLGVVAAGCDDDSLGPQVELPQITSVQVVDTLGPIMRSLRVELDEPGRLEVYYQPTESGRTFRMRSESALSHDILMPRLLADTTYRYAVRTFAETAASDSVSRGEFTTGPLPAALQNVDLTVEGEATFPLLIFGHSTPDFQGEVAIEPDGTITWYTTAAGFGLAATPIPGSHDMLFLTREGEVDGIARVSPRGVLVDSFPRSRVPNGAIHHDIAAIDSERVAMIFRERQTVGDSVVGGDGIWLWNMETGESELAWSAFHFLDWETDRGPRTRAADWLHGNAIAVAPDGNIVMSYHFLDQVVSIAPDFQSIEWRLGGVNATIGVSDDDQFSGQHSAAQLEDGHVLLFDNRGGGPADDYSRGLEFEIQGDTAVVAWEYGADPPLYARIWSGIYALPNGHRVVTFASPPDLFTVDEADADGNRVWRLTGPHDRINFRAVPWPSISGEERVEGMP